MAWAKKILVSLSPTEAITILAALEKMQPTSELELLVVADTLHHVQTAYDKFKKA